MPRLERNDIHNKLCHVMADRSEIAVSCSVRADAWTICVDVSVNGKARRRARNIKVYHRVHSNLTENSVQQSIPVISTLCLIFANVKSCLKIPFRNVSFIHNEFPLLHPPNTVYGKKEQCQTRSSQVTFYSLCLILGSAWFIAFCRLNSIFQNNRNISPSPQTYF
jgi:hypothetical protein